MYLGIYSIKSTQYTTHLLKNVDGVGQLAVHDPHLPPDLPDVLLHLGGESVEGISLIGEDRSCDCLKLGREIVIHLSSRQLNQLRHLRRQ